jgi:hypothetical protein
LTSTNKWLTTYQYYSQHLFVRNYVIDISQFIFIRLIWSWIWMKNYKYVNLSIFDRLWIELPGKCTCIMSSMSETYIRTHTLFERGKINVSNITHSHMLITSWRIDISEIIHNKNWCFFVLRIMYISTFNMSWIENILLNEARKSSMETPHAVLLIYHNKVIATGHNNYRYSGIFTNHPKCCFLCS